MLFSLFWLKGVYYLAQNLKQRGIIVVDRCARQLVIYDKSVLNSIFRNDLERPYEKIPPPIGQVIANLVAFKGSPHDVALRTSSLVGKANGVISGCQLKLKVLLERLTKLFRTRLSHIVKAHSTLRDIRDAPRPRKSST